jgi:hypothetical protein
MKNATQGRGGTEIIGKVQRKIETLDESSHEACCDCGGLAVDVSSLLCGEFVAVDLFRMRHAPS